MTQFSNFSIRILMYAALNGPAPNAVPEIARVYGISYDHVKKVAAALCRLGYLDTVRGRSGGVRLVQPAETIGIGTVIRATEGTVILVECFDPATNTCPLAPACKLKIILAEALDAFFAVLDRYTLADLVAAPEQLEALLRVIGSGVTAEPGTACPRSRPGQPLELEPVTEPTCPELA